jgi:ATP-dependent Lon protease
MATAEAQPEQTGDGLGFPIRLYDPDALRRAIGVVDDDGFVGIEDERPSTAPPRTNEEDVRAFHLKRILDDPRGSTRPSLHGTSAMAARLVAATSSLRHFSAVTGIVERAVLQSAFTGRPLRLPPILMISAPGLGKTFYCRTVAEALCTTCIPISINGTSDRGRLGGLSPLWRGAKMGKIAHGLLVESVTAAPLFLLDEIDKPPALVTGENTLDVLLSALEPENARAFVDEYVDVPIDLRSALWLASANDASAMPTPLVDRMLVVDVPWPDREGARRVAAAIATDMLARSGLEEVVDDAIDAIVHLAPRRMKRVLELAAGFAASDRRLIVGSLDVCSALDLAAHERHRRAGFLPVGREGGR